MRRNATLLVAVSLLSGFGSTALTLAAAVWVLDLTGSVGLAGLTGLCIYAPTLAAPWLGAMVDRLPRRLLLIVVDSALGLFFLSLLTVRTAAQVWLVYVALLLLGVAYVLNDAGESAILPAAVPKTALATVNGWRSSAQEGAKLLAPVAGAALYAWQGPRPVVLLCSALPLLSAACYAGLRLTAFTSPKPAGARPGFRAGLRALFLVPAVRTPVLLAAVAIAMSGLTAASLLARITEGLHLSAPHLGVLSSAQGAGSIAGGLLVGRVMARTTLMRTAFAGAALFAAGRLLCCLPWWPALIAGSVLVGIGLPWPLISAVTAVQTRTPDDLLGRVSATSNTVMFGPVALAVPLGSALVYAGAIPTLALAALVTLAAGLLALRAARQAEPSVAAP